jgi:hypothetical protein
METGLFGMHFNEVVSNTKPEDTNELDIPEMYERGDDSLDSNQNQLSSRGVAMNMMVSNKLNLLSFPSESNL